MPGGTSRTHRALPRQQRLASLPLSGNAHHERPPAVQSETAPFDRPVGSRFDLSNNGTSTHPEAHPRRPVAMHHNKMMRAL